MQLVFHSPEGESRVIMVIPTPIAPTVLACMVLGEGCLLATTEKDPTARLECSLGGQPVGSALDKAYFVPRTQVPLTAGVDVNLVSGGVTRSQRVSIGQVSFTS